jgi:hypothetical protein
MVARTLRLALLTACALAMVACGGGNSGSGGGAGAGKKEAKARKLPDYGELRPGRYVTGAFEPAFSFVVDGEG